MSGSSTAATPDAAAEPTTGAAAAVGSKMNLPLAPTIKLPPGGMAPALVAISVPASTIVPPPELSLPLRIKVPLAAFRVNELAAARDAAGRAETQLPGAAPLPVTVRLPARTTRAEIECVPMSTVIEPPADVPKVNAPPLLPAPSA